MTTSTFKLAGILLSLHDDEYEHDYLDVLEELKTLLPEQTFKTLCEETETCPVHVCDIQICLDDKEHGLEVYE